MARYDFIWTRHNERKVAEHGVTPEEAEEVVENPHRSTTSRSSGRPIAFGFTSTGKYIAVVYERIDPATVYVITGYEVDD